MSAPIPSGAAKVMRACSKCSTPITAKSKSGMCRPCVNRDILSRPEFWEQRRAKMAAKARPRHNCQTCGKLLSIGSESRYCLPCFNRATVRQRGEGISRAHRRRIQEDPSFAAQLRERGRALGKSGIGNAACPKGSEARMRAGRKVREHHLGWCPEEYRDFYRDLIDRKHMLKRDAKRMIEGMIHASRMSVLAEEKLHGAIFHLRRLTPVYEAEGGYRYGTVILTPEQLVERALQKGWQPE